MKLAIMPLIDTLRTLCICGCNIYTCILTAVYGQKSKHQIFITGDVKALSSEKSPLVMKDVKWYTHNCMVGYMVSGE